MNPRKFVLLFFKDLPTATHILVCLLGFFPYFYFYISGKHLSSILYQKKVKKESIFIQNLKKTPLPHLMSNAAISEPLLRSLLNTGHREIIAQPCSLFVRRFISRKKLTRGILTSEY